MIPVDLRLCELLEAVMAQTAPEKNLQELTETAIGFMDQTNNLVQRNLHTWPDSKINRFGIRVPRYGSIIQAFHSIKTGKSTLEIIDLGIKDCRLLYTDIDEQFVGEWNSTGSQRRKTILEEVLIPHLLILRYLERYKNDKLR